MSYDILKPHCILSMELPMPLSFYEKLGIASRTTIWRWEKLGLRIIREGGRTYLIPSDLREFLTREKP